MSFRAARDIRIIAGNNNDYKYEDFIIIAFEILGWLKLEHLTSKWLNYDEPQEDIMSSKYDELVKFIVILWLEEKKKE